MNTEKFLEELSALTRKHKIQISGCGCCGSPFLYELSEGEEHGEYRVGPGDDLLNWETKE